MRLFIAFILPEEWIGVFRQTQEELQKNISGVSWVKPDAMHCTLKFIGDFPDPHTVNEVLVTIPFTPFSITAAQQCSVFGRQGKASVFFVPFEPLPPVAELAGKIDESLAVIGIERENRPFKAHITLGRVKQDMKSEIVAPVLQKIVVQPLPSHDVRSFHLIKSTLLPSGPHYDILYTYGG